MTGIRRGVLEGRGTALAAFLIFSYLGARSWASIGSGHHLAPDHVLLGGLLFSAFITGSIAYRSPLLVDRVAFGAATAVFLLLAAIRALAPLGPTTLLVLEGTKSLMWTVAAAVALAVLVRGPGNAHRDGEQHE
jgi:hypothetical protein